MITRTSKCNEEHAIGPYTGSFTRIAHATNICICNPRPNRGQRTVGNATLLSVQLQERNHNTLYPVLSNLLLSVPPRPFYVFHCVAVGRRGERGGWGAPTSPKCAFSTSTIAVYNNEGQQNFPNSDHFSVCPLLSVLKSGTCCI